MAMHKDVWESTERRHDFEQCYIYIYMYISMDHVVIACELWSCLFSCGQGCMPMYDFLIFYSNYGQFDMDTWYVSIQPICGIVTH